jgi:hypothetical protein
MGNAGRARGAGAGSGHFQFELQGRSCRNLPECTPNNCFVQQLDSNHGCFKSRLNTVLGNIYGNNIAIIIGKNTNIAINIGWKQKIAVVIGKITVIAIPYNNIGPTSVQTRGQGTTRNPSIDGLVALGVS